MHQRILFGVAAVLLLSAVSSIHAGLQTPKRVVTLGIVAPNAAKDASPARLTVLEGGTGSLAVPDVGRFGFSPSFQPGDDKTVIVTIFDASTQPSNELGKVHVPVGGNIIQSKTKPSFGIQVINVK